MLTEPIVAHDHEADALPQAQGYYRPSMGKHLMHVEKSGPAFDSARAVTRLMKAISRGVFLDVIPAWTDLLAALNIQPSPLSLSEAYWPGMVDAIHAALLAGPDAELLWAAADEQVRGYAKVAAIGWDNDAKRTQGGDQWDDVEDDRRADILHAHSQAARLRAFAGVR